MFSSFRWQKKRLLGQGRHTKIVSLCTPTSHGGPTLGTVTQQTRRQSTSPSPTDSRENTPAICMLFTSEQLLRSKL